MALDVEGRPICCEMWPGNTADVKTLLPVVKRMREWFRLREITVVADRGMVSQATLEAFENSDRPVRYIVGVRMRRQKEVSLSVLGSRAEPGVRASRNGAMRKIPSLEKGRLRMGRGQIDYAIGSSELRLV
jgi:transposase